MIRIDGGFGEGGGQILRTSLALSLVTGQPFRIDNIRAARERPGLLRQHLTAVEAAAQVGGAKVEGAALGSKSLVFTPAPVRAAQYRFTVGTAGSATLVLQTVLPALMLASEPSTLTIEGGTHNHAAPPYHFLEQTFAPLVERMGPTIALRLERYGFYPAGGGSLAAHITPVRQLRPLHLGRRGDITVRRIHTIAAHLPRHIAEREAKEAASRLNWGPETQHVETTRESTGPGNIIMIAIGSAEVTEIFSDFGKLGVSAEKVGSTAARDAREYLASSAAAGEHLTDQLLLPLAVAGAGSFTALKLNLHARTNMEVIGMFLPVRFQTADEEGCTRVSL